MKFVITCNISCLFELRFYGPVNLLGPCRARLGNLLTLFRGRLSPISGYPIFVHIVLPVTDRHSCFFLASSECSNRESSRCL